MEKDDKEIENTLKLIEDLHKRVVHDYLDTFKIMKSGTIKATNENCRKVWKFLEEYKGLLRGLGLDLQEIEPFEPVKFNEIKKRNENKVKMVKLFGVANQLYLSSCRILRIQPDYNYINIIITDINDENNKNDDSIKEEK